MLSKWKQFARIDIWRIRSRDLPWSKALLIRWLRIMILSVRGLAEDRCYLRASSLTFFSALAVVPVAATVFGIAKGFGYERLLERELLTRLEGQEEVVGWIIDFANNLLENIQGGMMASMGIVFLIYTIIMVLGNIEHAFNHIWGGKRERTFGRKIVDYIALIPISLVLLFVSGTITVIIASQVKTFAQQYHLVEAATPVIFFMLKLMQYGAIWVLFIFMYLYMPNTKVRFGSGALAGIIAGSIYQIFQVVYIMFQIGVARYNAIYGGFAALPLFLIWLQVSWLIVLFGAEISYAHQNVDTYEFEPDCARISHSFKKLLSLKVVHLLVKAFTTGGRSWNETQISKELDIPIRLVRLILRELLESGVVSQVMIDENNGVAYQPAMDPDSMTLKYVVDAIENHGSNIIPVANSEEIEKISASLKSFDDLIEKSPSNLRLKDM
jgi:membrane protein